VLRVWGSRSGTTRSTRTATDARGQRTASAPDHPGGDRPCADQAPAPDLRAGVPVGAYYDHVGLVEHGGDGGVDHLRALPPRGGALKSTLKGLARTGRTACAGEVGEEVAQEKPPLDLIGPLSDCRWVMTTVTSTYIQRGNPEERRARLLRGSQEDVARLEVALAQGWDVAKELDRARAQVKAFGG
jgi:hypothetical protein